MKRIYLMSALSASTVLTVTLLAVPAARGDSNGCRISLEPSKPSPQFVGERIVWTATTANCGNDPVYQYRVAGEERKEDRFEDFAESRSHSWKRPHFLMVRDFSPDNTFSWGVLEEGTYLVMVSVKDGFDAKDTTSAIVTDVVNSRVIGNDAVVTPTSNPLVALYSAPACEEGIIQVKFRQVGDSSPYAWMSTNALPCVRGQSRNFLVAGMLANTTYEMVHVSSEEPPSSPLPFTTGAPPTTLNFPQFTVRETPGPDSDARLNMIYHNLAGRPAANAVNLLATDLNGRIEWYYDPLQSGLVAIGLPGSSLVPGGTVLLGGRDRYRTLGLNVLREIDLGGTPLRETNIDAVNAQLVANGRPTIYGFHHEMLRLPDGKTATLGWTRKTVSLNGTSTDYVGDLLMVLDEDFQVVWTWDAFEHLDVKRGPILGDPCTGQPCPLPGTIDWLHDNAIARSASDGNLLLSVRHQSWVVKIDYADGAGDGHILWRLGKDGDFTIDTTDPDPWFSYQHFPHYVGERTLLLFDNGNARHQSNPNAHSRGQLWSLDEESMTASLVLNFDIGNFSDALGTAQRLPNGNFAFDSGSQSQPPKQFGQSIEMLPDGTRVYVLEVAARDYRALRIRGLYHGTHR